MNRDDYIQEVEALRAPAALRSRIAALPQQAVGRRRARAALRAVGMAACAACILLAVYGASVLWNMTHRGGDLRPYPPVLTAPPVLPTPEPTPEPTPIPTEPQGQYYSYTDPSLGLTVRAPTAWRDSFTFDFATLNSALRGSDGAVLSADTILFRPGAQGDDLTSVQREVLKAHPYARICWVPHGLTWPKADERDTDITLLETSGGDYVCRLYPGALEGVDPDTVAALDLQAACEFIQSGLRDGLCQAEGLYRPKMTALHHQVDGVDPNAEEVLDRVMEYIEEDQYESLHHYGTLDPNDYGCPVFDRWRISRLERCCQAGDLAAGHTLELYYLEWGVHTYAPELAQPHLAGHLTLSEDGWFVPEGGGVYLVFLQPEDGGSPILYDHFTAPRLDPDDTRTFTEENILGALMEYFSPAPADWTPDTGYFYTSEALGITVRFPHGWEKYFTFVEGRRSDFLHGTEDTSATVLTLIPNASTAGLFFEDPNLAHIYWVPDGAAGPEEYSLGNTSVVLAETGAGKYVCLLNVWSKVWLSPSSYLAEGGPLAVDDLAAAYSAVQNGVLFYSLPRVEVLHGPDPSAPTPAGPAVIPDGIVSENINVPDDVRNAAVEWVTERYATYVENPDGAWRHPDAVYDNWRIDAIEPCEYLSGLAYRPVQVYRLSWQLHTATPELGGNQAGAYQPVVAGWFTPGYGCDYLAFLCTDDHDYFFAYLMINDVSPGSDAFSSDVERSLLARIPAPKPEVETYQDPGVPDRVIYQAGEYIRDQYLLAHLPQTYGEAASRPAGSYDDDWAVDALPDFDGWRITSVNKCYEVSMEDLALGLGTAAVYRLDYQLHTTTPEKLQPLLADGQLLDGDGWFTQRPNGVYLVFRMSNEGLLTFLSVLPESDASPSSQPFQEAVTQSLTGSGYILGYMASTLAGVEIGAPLEKQPAELLAALTPQGDPWEGTPWHTKDPAWSICQRYTAPGIEIITSKVPPEKLESYLHAYDASDPEALAALLEESGASSVEAIYGQEIDREYVARITVTGPEYATNLGVRVGMTRSEVQALYQRLAGGKAISNQTIMEASISIEYTGDTVSKLEIWDMLGRRVGRFFDL